MKKFILFASVFAGLFAAASCQQEKLEPEMNGGVTYEISLPTAPQTKGENGYSSYDLHYEVYKTADASALETAPLLFEKTVQMTSNTTTVTLELLNDQDYTVLFWANKKGTDYFKINDENDLRNVGIKQTAANNDDRDAFCGKDQIKNHNGGAPVKTVTLTRPFAQLNIATLVPSKEQIGYDVTPSKSYVKISDIPTAFNVFTGLPEGQATAVEFSTKEDPATIPADSIYVEGKGYKWVAMNYIVVPESVVEVYYEITTANGVVKNTINNVPVKKNYRTNIIGNLLTSNATYNIEILPGFEGDNGVHVEVINEGITKNINGDYEITNEKGLAYAVNNLFVDANGVANTATFYVKPGLYDMAEQAIKDITVTSGTLKVYDTLPVVTRSVAIGGVVIEGLDKALINTVAEGATVFFSGITVTDFGGADNAAALVQNNKGKVVLADCQILDETGTPDPDNTKLVGGNAPVEVEKGEEESGVLIYTADQLAAAFADETVESIALGADIALENTLVFPEDRTATLDLRGWNLMSAENMPLANPLVSVYGDLTVIDSYGIGSITASKTSAIYANNGGKLTINCNVSAHESAVRAEGGEIVISGGKYVQTGTYYSDPSTLRYAIDCRADAEGNVGKLAINGGEFVSNNGLINAGGEVTINGGKFNNDISEVAATRHMMYVNGSAIVNINGGEFYGKANGGAGGEHICVYTSKATVNIAAGKFTSLKGNGSANSIISEYSAGSAISVTGGIFNTDLGLTKYIHKDYKAVKNAETAMWDVVEKVYVAKIGENGYESLQEAVEAVKDGETITFVADVEQVDGIIITDKNIDIDLNDKTFKVSEGASTNNRNFKINGSSVVTIKNGTMIAAGEYSSGAYGTLRTEGTAKVTLDDVKLYNYRGNGLNVKALSGTTVTIKDTEIYSQYGGGVEAAGGTVELTNVKVEQKGMYTAPYNSMAISVNGGGTATVNSGTYSTECITAEEANNQGTSHGPWCAGVLNSGGTLIIKGGTFSNDNFGDNSLATYARGLLLADTAANIQIEGGIFNAVKAIVDVTNNLGDASRQPSVTLVAGNFSSDPRVSGLYASHLISVADGSVVKETEDGRFTIGRPVAKVGNTEYGSIDEAIAAWSNNTTLTLLSDVTLSDVVTLKSTEHHILNLGTYTMTAASGMNAIEITCNGRSSASYALTVNADAINPGGITAIGKACIYYKKSDSTKDRPIILINNGVFTGSYSINSISNGNTNCPQIWINGGVFNSYMNLTKNLLQVKGGTFHAAINCTGDQNAYRLFAGGRFKSWQFMTADAPNKFAVSSTMSKDSTGAWIGTYDVGVYVDDEGYLVVGGPVITEFGDKFAAKATNATKWSSYLKYSSAAEHGLYYTNAALAIEKHGEANVELK